MKKIYYSKLSDPTKFEGNSFYCPYWLANIIAHILHFFGAKVTWYK